MFALRWPSPLTHLMRHAPTKAAPLLRSHAPLRVPSAGRGMCTTTPTHSSSAQSFLRSYRLALAIALPVAALSLPAFTSKPLECSTARPYADPDPELRALGQPVEAESMINVKELSFGAVSGICVGIFVGKGLKIVGFALGGIFVLLQYLSSRAFITVNWSGLTNSYDSFITKRAGPAGGNRVVGLWATFIDFISADIQGRGTFIAGILLGLRIS